jgi:hypothetical protein
MEVMWMRVCDVISVGGTDKKRGIDGTRKRD